MTFSTTTTFVNTGLTTEKNDRLEENDVFQYPVSIASTLTNEYQLVSKELDLEVLSQVQGTIDVINKKKRELIGLGEIAAGAFEPGVFPPVCGLSSDTDDINNNVSSGNRTISAVQGVGGGTTTPAVAYSVIRGDAVRIRRYPYLENRESPNDKALDGEKFPVLTSGNAGEGKENLYFENSKYTDSEAGVTYYVTDDEGNWNVTGFESDEGGNVFGRYYPVDSSVPTNVEIRIPGEVSRGLVFTSGNLYSGITSFFTGIQTGHWTRNNVAPVYVEWNTVTGQIELEGLAALGSLLYVGEGTLAVNASETCAGIAASQTSIQNDIDSLRVGLGTYFVSSNTTKLRKHNAQLQLWSGERIKTRNLEESKGQNNNPRNIEVAVPTVESVDGNLPTNTNTADRTNITSDNTLLTSDSK